MSKSGNHGVSFSAHGEGCFQLIQQFFKEVETDGEITHIEISLESTKPIQKDGATPTPLTQETPNNSSEQTETKDTTPTENGESEDIVSFNPDSDPYTVAKTLLDRRDAGFIELGQIQQFVPNDAGIPDERFSPILWDMSNRGLVEKKDHPEDGRKNVYRLTDKGVNSVVEVE